MLVTISAGVLLTQLLANIRDAGMLPSERRKPFA
jgi:hypothetical protein